jgi:hypothetical protein
VYNNHRFTNPSILDQVPQQCTLWELVDPITWDEFFHTVCKLKCAKDQGLTRVPPKVVKAMHTGNQILIYHYVNIFFIGNSNYEQWHRSQCIPVQKSSNLLHSNKWQGVMLMDVCSQVFRSIMNEQAFKLLAKHGLKFQFVRNPELGCHDSLFILKRILNMQINHNLASYVGFVDLVKAYDTANHDLLYDILKKYGAPPRFIAAIAKCYQDLIVMLKIKKEVVELPQTIGARQGNNIAPVLLLFLMLAFAETQETEWRNVGTNVCTVRLVTGSDHAAGKGKIWGHLLKEYLSRTLTGMVQAWVGQKLLI